MNMCSIDRVINQFNNDYPLLEKNIKTLILKNSILKSYIYILTFVIFIVFILLVTYVITSLLSKQNQYR
jgi:hypothetical protein